MPILGVSMGGRAHGVCLLCVCARSAQVEEILCMEDSDWGKLKNILRWCSSAHQLIKKIWIKFQSPFKPPTFSTYIFLVQFPVGFFTILWCIFRRR